MENQEPNEIKIGKDLVSTNSVPVKEAKPSFFKKHQNKFLIFFAICLIGFVFYTWYKSIQAKQKRIDELSAQFENEQSIAAQRAYTIDSTMRVIKLLSKYRGLTDAMYYRDSIRLPFKYRPGDFAYLKLDSSKVLIIDMIAGGDLNNYYFKYKVQYCKTKEIEEISPVLVY